MSNKSNLKSILHAWADVKEHDVIGRISFTKEAFAKNFPRNVTDLAGLVEEALSKEGDIKYISLLEDNILMALQALEEMPANYVNSYYSIEDYSTIFKAFSTFDKLMPGALEEMNKDIDKKLGFSFSSSFATRKPDNQSTKNCQEILPPELDT
ncbi:MAG: hypothetical protein CMH26_09420 [Micavibrio sp.]|nr:hypothetical protein [Micavibrio sp.]|tara:strand:- start:1616 stop:2074 length:459 start_codon:yes stop_codon:yes gene_type:complete